jgi:hypothetical protein
MIFLSASMNRSCGSLFMSLARSELKALLCF